MDSKDYGSDTAGQMYNECLLPYVAICKESLHNDELFDTFKSNVKYHAILEHVTYEQIILKLKYFKNKYNKYSNYLSIIDWGKIKLNDTIGNAEQCNFKEEIKELVELDNYYFSPSTLRYLIEGFEILFYFSEYSKSTEIDILEIGGGYGGQCYILLVLSNTFNINIKSYTIIDLEYVTLFQEKYLDKLGININTINYQDMDNMFKNSTIFKHSTIFKKNYNILLSNYALGEVSKETQEVYFENLIYNKYTNIEFYYMVWNQSWPPPTRELSDYFNNDNFIVTEEVPNSSPSSTNFNRYEKKLVDINLVNYPYELGVKHHQYCCGNVIIRSNPKKIKYSDLFIKINTIGNLNYHKDVSIHKYNSNYDEIVLNITKKLEKRSGIYFTFPFNTILPIQKYKFSFKARINKSNDDFKFRIYTGIKYVTLEQKVTEEYKEFILGDKFSFNTLSTYRVGFINPKINMKIFFLNPIIKKLE